MSGVVLGFVTVAVLIGFGSVLAHLRILDAAGQRTLSAVAFFVASPALLFTVLQDSDVHGLFSGNLIALTAAVLVSGAVTVAIAVARRRDLGESVIAALCAAYANAGNLGLPIAAYVLGDAALIAPLLLLQLLVLQSLALTILDVAVSEQRPSRRRILSRPVRNPITLASAAGLAVALAGIEVPRLAAEPLEVLAGMAVPAMLLAYGVSLRLGPLPGRGVPPGELGLAVVLKLVVQPVTAYLVGRLLGLDDAALLAVTVIASLPTAQNVFIIANRYRRAELLARDAIFVSTIGCVPVIFIVVALLA
ncbi:AEC family transporter [Nocardioides sp. GXZ039]|uniref:AEC family transporter n=1 Tax=Nocardioides sp. GXZ039 TaxID=3136018 RepID=UPI0030F44951